jgi:hypothetical protein
MGTAWRKKMCPRRKSSFKSRTTSLSCFLPRPFREIGRGSVAEVFCPAMEDLFLRGAFTEGAFQ